MLVFNNPAFVYSGFSPSSSSEFQQVLDVLRTAPCPPMTAIVQAARQLAYMFEVSGDVFLGPVGGSEPSDLTASTCCWAVPPPTPCPGTEPRDGPAGDLAEETSVQKPSRDQ
jgi:hypothetical protein